MCYILSFVSKIGYLTNKPNIKPTECKLFLCNKKTSFAHLKSVLSSFPNLSNFIALNLSPATGRRHMIFFYPFLCSCLASPPIRFVVASGSGCTSRLVLRSRGDITPLVVSLLSSFGEEMKCRFVGGSWILGIKAKSISSLSLSRTWSWCSSLGFDGTSVRFVSVKILQFSRRWCTASSIWIHGPLGVVRLVFLSVKSSELWSCVLIRGASGV